MADLFPGDFRRIFFAVCETETHEVTYSMVMIVLLHVVRNVNVTQS